MTPRGRDVCLAVLLAGAATPARGIQNGIPVPQAGSGVPLVNDCSGVFVTETGSSILNADWIVSARHCFPDSLVRRPGSVSVQYAGQTFQATTIIRHPTLDVALVRIGGYTGETPAGSVPFRMSLDTHPYDPSWPYAAQWLDCFGYGPTNRLPPDGGFPLTFAEMQVIDTGRYPGMFTATSRRPEHPTHGDSGGPCFVWGTKTVVGIVSTAASDGTANYVPAGSFAAWAKAKIAETDHRDLTGDGRADLIWQDYVWSGGGGRFGGFPRIIAFNTGAWAAYYDDRVVADAYNPLSIFEGGSTWLHVVGMGDFTGDGHTDLLVRDLSNGNLWAWGMWGPYYMGANYLATVDLGWAVEGVGDFNGDQQQDILWRNTGTGEVVVWFMAGTESVDLRNLGSASTDWRIEGVADFNADGQSDILWRNRQTGELAIWVVGRDFTLDTGSLVLPAVADLNWQIVGVADLNNDGMADILWNYMPSGFLGAWILEYNTTDRLKVRWDRDGTVFDSSQSVVHDGAPLGLSLWRTIAAPR